MFPLVMSFTVTTWQNTSIGASCIENNVLGCILSMSLILYLSFGQKNRDNFEIVFTEGQ